MVVSRVLSRLFSAPQRGQGTKSFAFCQRLLSFLRSQTFKFQVSFHCVGTTTTSAISAHVPAELTLKRFLILGSVCSMYLVTYDTVYTQAQLSTILLGASVS